MKTKYWIALLSVLFLLLGGLGIFLLTPGEDAQRAEILSDGKVVHTVELYTAATYTVTTESGGWNQITVRDGKIAVTDASCPDHYCMDRGFCAGGAQIVCLPNRLIIRFLEDQAVDFVVG